ncbi:hypothetical protein [Pasteurella canis]|uniref:hypothetical protein n=1 Tax=Pasteurella canis TaxID=753 RepID=UPI001E51DBBA|nr:hypothetical protein [Pasteurella canis]UEC23854.1 hypothetical protein K7G93_000616 [Pasteurella canis]
MKTSHKLTYVASFMIGMGSILNIGSIFTPINVRPASDDQIKLKEDWSAVGGYLYKAMRKSEDAGKTTG